MQSISDLCKRAARGCAASVLALALVPAAAGAAPAPKMSASGGASAQDEAPVSSEPPAKQRVRVVPPAVSVVKVQRALGVRADGVAGRATRRALARFQRSKGLRADGIAGPETLKALGIEFDRGSEKEVLEAISKCESGGDPTAISKNGLYRGKYQFNRATWRSVGGSGDPAEAPEAEQDLRALKLLEIRGTAPWPVCGQNA